MKIKIPDFILISVLFLAPILIGIIIIDTPNSDFYSLYYIAGRILENPSLLWDKIPDFEYMTIVPNYSTYLGYPPLLFFLYIPFIITGISYKVLFFLCVVAFTFLLYKMKREALPIMLLSFMFFRTTIFGYSDIILAILLMVSLYFLEKKPLISGIAVGLCPLIKGIGFLVFAGYVGIVLIKNFKFIFNKSFEPLKFIKTRAFLSIVIAILIFSPWYIKNFIVYKDIVSGLIGQSKDEFKASENFLKSGKQVSSPERSIIDKSQWYPLPIDILLHIGPIFVVINFLKTRKFELYYVYIILFLLAFYLFHLLNIAFFSSWRYIIPIFPLIAIEMSKILSKKVFTVVLVICLLVSIFWLKVAEVSSFKKFSITTTEKCNQARDYVDSEPVYIIAHQNWYVVLKCNFNTTSEEYALWVFDFDKGDLYGLNKTTEGST